MNTERVFTTFDNENKEILLYRENSDTYIDLNKKETVKKDDIDLESLRFISDTIKVLKYMPESLITKLYNYDRNKLIDTKSILVGLKGTITDLKEIKTKNGWYLYGIPMYDYNYEWDLNNKRMGLYTYNKEILEKDEHNVKQVYKLYKDLYNGASYIGFNNNVNGITKLSEFGEGFSYIRFDEYTLFDLIKEPVLEKKKVYEYANETRKEKLESEK